MGIGPFAIATSAQGAAILEAYAFLTVASASSLIAAAALSERQDAIGQLRDSREQYRNVVETATDPIVTIDSRNRIRFANSATERVFGFSRGELLGRDLTLLVPGAKNTGARKDGREIPLEVSSGRVVEPGAELTLILRDISEKRAAERALETLEEQYRQAQKMESIGQLAGGIAHDFNNLLTVVQVNCELLLERLEQTSDLRPELAQIHAAAQRAASLTRQLLAFSRRQLLEPRVMSLADSLQDIEPMLNRLLGEHVITRLSVPQPVGPVLADPGQIEQVLLNLAINARDAMPGGGLLTIALTEVTIDAADALLADVRPGPYARLEVTDTGFGMDEQTAARVFEPFFTTKPMGRGTGLGLSTAHGIVKQSGGGIRVRSRPGEGATFEVLLPRVEGPVDRGRRRAEPAAAGPTRDLVLVVEDEQDVGRLARRILERHGYRVLLAASPREALDVAAREPGIDLLLTDVVLPEMSGRRLADQLLLTHPQLRVVYMSGYTDDALSDHGVLESGTAFVEKPFTSEVLVSKLRAEMRERRQP
jgi:signal transduction histidine kinase/CheY-like chemotaxis protein